MATAPLQSPSRARVFDTFSVRPTGGPVNPLPGGESRVSVIPASARFSRSPGTGVDALRRRTVIRPGRVGSFGDTTQRGERVCRRHVVRAEGGRIPSGSAADRPGDLTAPAVVASSVEGSALPDRRGPGASLDDDRAEERQTPHDTAVLPARRGAHRRVQRHTPLRAHQSVDAEPSGRPQGLHPDPRRPRRLPGALRYRR